MRFSRRDRRGLAEIVGTLMLVVIVVAAATAFSFFVAAYQKQVQAQETLTHDRALEDVKVLGVEEVTCSTAGTFPNLSPEDACETGAPGGSFWSVTVLISSLDVNNIGIAGLALDGHPILNYTVTTGARTPTSPCYNGSVTGWFPGIVPCSAWVLPPNSMVSINLTLDTTFVPGESSTAWVPAFGLPFYSLSPSSDITFEVITELTNVFTETFSPPDAIASVFFVSNGSGSVPVFDGLSSYQPAGAVNASILWYNWTIANSAGVALTQTGAEFECSDLAAGSYDVTLTVTNTEGLTGTSSFEYVQPAPA